jgi:gluconolactonase
MHLLSLSLVLFAVWIPAIAQSPPSGIEKMDASLDDIVPPGAKLERLVRDGFEGGEGPVWVQTGNTGHLLFTGAAGRVYQWTPDCFTHPCPTTGKLSVFLENSGQRDPSNKAPAAGANGLALDSQHRLLLASGGARGVLRLESNGTRTLLPNRHEGKLIGCPNDLTAKSDGSVYFTEGGAGCIPGGEQNAELAFHGVYLVKDGKLLLLDQDPGGYPPNGIALSPDEKTLYVTNGGPIPERRQIYSYDVQPDGTARNRRLFLNLLGEQGLGGPDGVKVDSKGNVYTAATGGAWIVSAGGKRLGRITAPPEVRFSNLAFGDSDGKTLYLVSAGNLWRIRLRISGLR